MYVKGCSYKMKRFIACLLIIITAYIGVCYAAEDKISIDNVAYNQENDSITVCGSVSSVKSNIPLVMKITKDGTTVNIVQQTADRVEDDTVKFEFKDVMFNADAESGEYVISVSGHYVDNTDSCVYTYYGPDILLEVLSDLKSAAINKDKALITKLTQYNQILSINLELISRLDENAEQCFLNIMSKTEITLPEGCSDSEERKQIKKAAADFVEMYNYASAVSGFVNIQNKTEFDNWYDTNKEKYSLRKDNADTDINEEDFLEFFDKVRGESKFIERVKKIYSEDMEEIKTEIYKEALLASIEVFHYTKMQEIVEGFPDIFNINSALYSGLSETQKGKMYSALAGKQYSSCIEVKNAIDEYIKKLSQPSNNYTGGSGNGTGSSSGSVVGKVDMPNRTIDENSGVKKAFEDIENVAWAHDAINYMYENGIIDGRGNNLFCPNDNITRAEFIKLLIKIENESTDDTKMTSFNDVITDDWYYEFVATAEAKGWINGDDKNNFKPNENISRQDIAVIICRAKKLYGSDKRVFDDYLSISDYAKPSVSELAQMGIVNGMGDNNFCPFKYATRAETVKILYNLIKMA